VIETPNCSPRSWETFFGLSPSSLFELGCERHRARAEHRGGRAEGVGCLEGMAALVAAAAASAVADPDIEAPTDRPQLGQLLLVLVGDSIELDLPAALAAVGKRGAEHLIDLLGGRPVGPLAVVGSGPSARPTGIALPLLTRERGGLAFRLAPQFLDLALEPGDAIPLALVLGAQACVLSLELVVSGYEAGELVIAGAGRRAPGVERGGMGHRGPPSLGLT